VPFSTQPANVKAGVYLAARMHSFGPWTPTWSASLIWIGTITMAVGVMYAMVQTDLKRMLAFSTVSQIGYMMMGIGIGTPLAITAGLLHCLNHGFFKGGLFLTAGLCTARRGHPRHEQARRTRAAHADTTLSWLIGVWQHDGIPLMSGFRQQVDALCSGAAIRAGRFRQWLRGPRSRHGLPRRQGNQRGLSWPSDREHQRRARISLHNGLGNGLHGRREHRARV
jgi:formate hydrogenlyase subunit 3/multisubunit Na+/H+ antiporter MnhD subunit